MLRRIQLVIILSVLAFSSAFADGVWIAILETTGDKKIEAASKRHITDKIRAEAVKIFKDKTKFKIIDKDSFKERLPKDSSLEDCTEQCAVEIGKKISANYIVQSIIGKPETNYTLGITVYDVSNGTLVGSITFDDSNIRSFDKYIEKNSPNLFEAIITKPWSGMEYKVDSSGSIFMKKEIIQKKIVRLESTPSGAKVIIDGTAASGCPKTPCSITVEEGSHDFKFILNRYAPHSQMVSIKEKNQVVNAKLTPTFGILRVRPKFTDGIGNAEDLIVNYDGTRYQKFDSIIVEDFERHTVALTHKCYESTEVKIGFNHGGQEHVIDSSLTVSNSLLDLNVVNDQGSPIEVDVYVNGVKKGVSPFTAYVPTCSQITVGPFREKVDANLKKNTEERVTYPYKGKSSYTDKRGSSKTYNLVVIGDNIWFGENLRYKKGSNCVSNYYGDNACYYSYSEAMVACPEGYHMATKEDWNALKNVQNGIETLSLTYDGMFPYGSSQQGKGDYEFHWLEDKGYILFAPGEQPQMDSFEADNVENYRFPVRCVKDK